MRLPLCTLVAAAVAFAGCGGTDTGEVPAEPSPEATPTRTDVPDAESRGAQVLVDAGCLACHRLADEGNAEPGGELDDVGARLDEGEVEASLTDPPEGMPAYEGLPDADFDALVGYLSGLR